MKYKYRAYFYSDDEGTGYRVTVPSLELEMNIERAGLRESKRQVKAELTDLLRVYEYDGLEIPLDEKEGESGYEVEQEIKVDTGGAVGEIRKVY